MGTTHRQNRPITDADLALLHRLHRGDGAAFGELYTRTAQTLTRYVAARLRDQDGSVVDDLVHDAFCDALADPALLGPDLLGSMLRLTACAVNRHHQEQLRYTRAAHSVYYDRTSSDALAARTIAVLARPGFSHALARLTALQRRAIQLRYVDGYPRDRAAQAMGRSLAAMRDLERRALRRLREACTV